MIPVSGKHHERARSAASARFARFHGCGIVDGCEICRSWTRFMLDAYHRSLREQGVRLVEQPKCPYCEGTSVVMRGAPDPDCDPRHPCPRCGGTGHVRLVDLREVVEFVNTIVALPPALIPDVLPDAIERRFGGNERSE